MITVDINKAKEVWKSKIRHFRISALQKLDVEFIRATEQGLDTSSIVANKQLLRDLPNQVDTANSIDEIKAVWNNLLNK